MRYLSDPGPQDTLHGADLYHIWDGACPIPIYHVTIRIKLGLVGIEGNHPSSTRDRLLGSYRSRVSCNHAPPAYIRVGRDPLERHLHLRQYKPPHRT